MRIPKWVEKVLAWFMRARAAGLVNERPGNLGAVMHERKEARQPRRKKAR